MLTVSTLRSILTAALGPEAAGFVDALQTRDALPADNAALDVDHFVSALMALLSGGSPTEAVEEMARMRGFVPRRFSQRWGSRAEAGIRCLYPEPMRTPEATPGKILTMPPAFHQIRRVRARDMLRLC